MHSHGGGRSKGGGGAVEYDSNGRRKKKKKRKTNRGSDRDRDRGGRSSREKRGGGSGSNRGKGKRRKKSHTLPMFDRRRGMPRHCMCLEMCFGWNGQGPRHNIQHLPPFECMDKKTYRPGQRRRHSRFFYCYRNVGNWITALFILIGLTSAVLALWLYFRPCTPIIDRYQVLENLTEYSDEKVTHVNYKYDAANVFIMLDFSGSISGLWTQELQAAESVIDIFQGNLSASAPFRAGAIRWGTTPAYLTARAGPPGSGLGEYTAALGQDIGGLKRALDESKSKSPNQATEFLQPFGWYEREMDLRSTRAIMGPNSGIVHHEFAVFITDGEASDYKPDSSVLPREGKDVPFNLKDDYTSASPGGDEAVNMFCNKRGWCSGSGGTCSDGYATDPLTNRIKEWPCPCTPNGKGSSYCNVANVVATIKNRPNTKVLGIFVGENARGSIALHSLASCDGYDLTDSTRKCPYYASVKDFKVLQTQLLRLIGQLAAEVSTSTEIVTTFQQVPTIVQKQNVTLVEVCEKDANILLMLLLLLPLLVWCMALPTYVLTKAICCPDFVYEESSSEEEEEDAPLEIPREEPPAVAVPEPAPPIIEYETVTETHVHVVQDTLPAPWVMYTDKDSGQPYYYNTLTGETRWVRPGESAADFGGPKLSRVDETESNATYKWSAGTGRRINMTDEERLAHAQGARRSDAVAWRDKFKNKNVGGGNTTTRLLCVWCASVVTVYLPAIFVVV
jgi:hypothetical protein